MNSRIQTPVHQLVDPYQDGDRLCAVRGHDGHGRRQIPWSVQASMHWLSRQCLRFRFPLLAVGHVTTFVITYVIAFGLRFDFEFSMDMETRIRATLPLVVAVKLCVFYWAGHYHGWWRYVTLSDVWSLFKASTVSLLILVSINHYLLAGFIPRTVVMIDALLTILLLGALRASWRTIREHWQCWHGQRDRRLALMIGANHWNSLLAQQIRLHPSLAYRVVGFLDADPHRHGTRLDGVPVLGSPNDLARVAISSRATDVLVPADALSGQRLRDLLDTCKEHRLTLKVVPSVSDQLHGDGQLPVRDVEISDLLRRDAVELDTWQIGAEIHQQTVLVTGAGGSIGSEICRQLIPFGPRQIVLVDHGENALFLIHHELSHLGPPAGSPNGDAAPHPIEFRAYVADVRDEKAMRNIFEACRPAFVFHAAAHKHVGLMESNIAACVKNNVLGTRNLADIAWEFQVRRFVLISTDKAVNPTSIMGVSKHLAERYVHAMAHEYGAPFVVVRFGNVLGSNGSVVPLFQEQIRRGGPITITDERMMRYFMTIPEASQLVLQAAAMGKGGEIFVLEMGNPMSVVDLARDLVRLSGLPQDAVEIQFVGVRPGEKLFEELYFNDEQPIETSHPKVRAAYHRPYALDEVSQELTSLIPLVEGANEPALRDRLQDLVPEYRAHPLGPVSSEPLRNWESVSSHVA